MSLIGGLVSSNGRPRMKVERYIQLLNCGPKVVILRHVVESDGSRIAGLCKSIHQRTAKAKLLGAACQLLTGSMWILHRQCSEALQTFGILGDAFGEMIICPSCGFNGLMWICDRLNSGTDERDNAKFHTSSVHLRNASDTQILDAALKFRASE